MRRVFVVIAGVALFLTGWVGFSPRPVPEVPPSIRAAVATLPAGPVASPPEQSPPTTTTAVMPEMTVPSRVVTPPDPFPDLVRALTDHLEDPGLAGLDVSASVWVDGHGVVFDHNPDLELYPASNQKLLTAVGTLGLLPPEFRFTTELAVSGEDLIVVAGGDPTLTTAGLDELAAEVAEHVTMIEGSLIVDATRYDSARMAPGWLDWQMPTYVGPLSTFVVNDNRHRTDAAFLAEPDLGNADLLRASLEQAGVTVKGPIVAGTRPAGARTLATVKSSPRDDLVKRLLTRSDNEIAEALVREIGFVTDGRGSTVSGLAAIEAYIGTLGLSLNGQSGDGSGLSRASLRSAAEWQQLVVAAQSADWWPIYRDALPAAGQTGTLASRLGGAATAGNVRAKTGSIIGGRSLTGLLADRSGRQMVFSFVVNGETAGSAIPVIDRFVGTLAGYS